MKDNYEVMPEQQNNKKGNILNAINKKIAQFMFQKQQKADQQVVSSSIKFKKPAFLVDDMKNCYIDMKQSFEYVGDNSTFQKRITTILVFQMIAFSYMVNSMAFFFRSPTFKCKLPLTDIFVHCSQSIACFLNENQLSQAKVVYENFGFFDKLAQISITQQFDLTCNRSQLAPFAQSLFFLGGLLSGYLFSYLSQKIGRRSILIIVNVLCIISICICALAPNFQIFLIGYFLSGFCLFGYETSIYLYIGQISDLEQYLLICQQWYGQELLYFYHFQLQYQHGDYVFYFLHSSYQQLFHLPLNVFQKALDIQYLKDVIVKQYKYFKKSQLQIEGHPINLDCSNRYNNKIKHIQDINKEKRTNFIIVLINLIKYKSVRKITFILMYWWMFKFFMYFGLNLSLESIIKQGKYLTLMIAAASLIEVLGSFGITILNSFHKAYKLNIMKASILVTTICCFGLGFLQFGLQCKVQDGVSGTFCSQVILMIIFVLLVKFFNTVYFSGLISYSSEVYPTTVRSLGCGFTLTFGRLGTVIVPYYINYMKYQYPTKNSLCFMAPFGLIAYTLAYIMPITEEDGMKDQLQQEKQKKLIQLQNLR